MLNYILFIYCKNLILLYIAKLNQSAIHIHNFINLSNWKKFPQSNIQHQIVQNEKSYIQSSISNMPFGLFDSLYLKMLCIYFFCWLSLSTAIIINLYMNSIFYFSFRLLTPSQWFNFLNCHFQLSMYNSTTYA